VTLGEDYNEGTEALSKWICEIPGEVESVRIQAVFHHGSTLLVSMPIAVWDLSPDHPAFSFVGFVKSENLLLPPMSIQPPLPVPACNTHAGDHANTGIDDVVSLWPSDALKPVLGNSASSAEHPATLVLALPLSPPTTVQGGSSSGQPSVVSQKAFSTRAAPWKRTITPWQLAWPSLVDWELSELNAHFGMVADDVGKVFWGCSLSNPPVDATAEEKTAWEADMSKCDPSDDITFRRSIMMQIIDRHKLGDSLDYACESRWRCDRMPPTDIASHSQMFLPRPDLIVAFKSQPMLSHFQMADLGEMRDIMCPEGYWRAFPFFAVEPFTRHAYQNPILCNLHTATQGLHNMYFWMGTSGDESIFENVRFYSAVVSTRGFEVRVHRAVELDQGPGRIQRDYPLDFHYDVVLEKTGDYTKKEISTVVQKILFEYGVGILLPILKKAAVDILGKRKEKDGNMPSSLGVSV